MLNKSKVKIMGNELRECLVKPWLLKWFCTKISSCKKKLINSIYQCVSKH